MGLDMSAFRITKPELKDRVYSIMELRSMGYSCLTPSDMEEAGGEIAAFLPYTQKLKVDVDYVDMEKLQKHYSFDAIPRIVRISKEEYVFEGMKDGESCFVPIPSGELVTTFVIHQIDECVVYQKKEVAYWRKEYDVQDFFNEQVGPLENLHYYLLSREIQSEYNRQFGQNPNMARLPEEDATDTTAIFFWEWY